MGGIRTQRKQGQTLYAAAPKSPFALSISPALPTFHPFPHALSSRFPSVPLTRATTDFLRLQPCGRPWLLHGSPPPVPAWLEKQSEKDLGSWQKSAEDRERGATLLENGPSSLSSTTTHPL